MIALAAGLASCGGGNDGVDPANSAGGSGVLTAAGSAALLPEKVVLHPLTRIGSDPEGRPALVVHLEMRDRFGQSVKALGRLRVELYRPADALDTTGTVQSQDMVWSPNLADPEHNALLFDDLVTRTYTITLGGLPDWLIQWHGVPEKAGAPTVKAMFTFLDPQGREKTLTDTLRLMK